MKLDPKLNLVIPLERAGGATVYVHSTPLRREVFEANFLVIARTFARIYSEGLGFTAGPRICAMLLRDTADQLGQREIVEKGLIAEIKRLTNVLAPVEKGWDIVPFDEAVTRKILDEEEAGEVENALAFFIVASSMHLKKDLLPVLDGASKLWGARTESLNCTEFVASLKTSTGVANTGATAKPSSIPS